MWGVANLYGDVRHCKRAADRFAPALRRRVVVEKVRSHNPTSNLKLLTFSGKER